MKSSQLNFGNLAAESPAPFLLRFIEEPSRVPDTPHSPYGDQRTYMGPTGTDFDYESD